MSNEADGYNQGYSFLATIIAAGIIGYAIDHYAQTQPWGFLGFMCIGIIYATYKAQKAMNPPDQQDDPKKD
ncbi:MAG: AtpZ/AtpI family protein [Alphaproteobacteria bacterium]